MAWLADRFDDFLDAVAKFNPYHEPAGSPEGGRFAEAPDGGGATASTGSTVAAAGVTSSPAFRRWFGKSKVVDEAGNPRVVYHATNATGGIDVFKPGAHFGTEVAANDRARDLESFSTQIVGRDPGAFEVMPVYLKIEHPLRMPDLAGIDDQTGEPLSEAMIKFGGLSQEQQMHLQTTGEAPRARTWEGEEAIPTTLLEMGIINIDEFEEHRGGRRLYKLLQEKGYDGIVYENIIEDAGSDSYIVFDPRQVKSAIGNRGTFDPRNPDITKRDTLVSFVSKYREDQERAPEGTSIGGQWVKELHEVGITSARPERVQRETIAHDMSVFARRLEDAGIQGVHTRLGEGAYWNPEAKAVVTEPTWVLRYRGDGVARRLIADEMAARNQDAVILATRTSWTAGAVPRIRWRFDEGVDAKAVQRIAGEHGLPGWTWDTRRHTLVSNAIPQWQPPAQFAVAARRFSEALRRAGVRVQVSIVPVKVELLERGAKHASEGRELGEGAGPGDAGLPGEPAGGRRPAGGRNGSAAGAAADGLEVVFVSKGGDGSGHFGHEARARARGGSKPLTAGRMAHRGIRRRRFHVKVKPSLLVRLVSKFREDQPRGKTTPESTPGSFAPAPGGSGESALANITRSPKGSEAVQATVKTMFAKSPAGVLARMAREKWTVDVRSEAESAADKRYADGDVQAGGYTDDAEKRIVIYHDNADRAQWTSAHESGHIGVAELVARYIGAGGDKSPLGKDIANHLWGFVEATAREGTWSAYVGKQYFSGKVVELYDGWRDPTNKLLGFLIPRAVNENFAEYYAAYLTKGVDEVRARLTERFPKSMEHFLALMGELGVKNRPVPAKLECGVVVPEKVSPSALGREMQANRRRAHAQKADVATVESTTSIGGVIVHQIDEFDPETGRLIRRTWHDEVVKYDPDQARIPEGEPGGGRWVRELGAAGLAGRTITGPAFRVGALPSVPARVREAMATFASLHAGNVAEAAAAYSLDGKVVIEKGGTEQHVRFTADECAKLAGTHFVHNHPRGSSFSADDAALAAIRRTASMNAVGVSPPTGDVYLYHLETRGHPWSELAAAIDKASSEIYREWKARIDRGEMSEDAANAFHWHEVWTRLARTGLVAYERIKIGKAKSVKAPRPAVKAALAPGEQPDGGWILDVDHEKPIYGSESVAAKAEHEGFFIALWLRPEPAARLAIPGYESAESMHITLVYAGKAADYSADVIAAAVAGIRRVAATRGPLRGEVTGIGRFPASEASDGKEVLYAVPSVAGIEQFRQEIADAVTLAGVAIPDSHGRYQPHITLAYVDPGVNFRGDIARWRKGVPLYFDAVTVRAGDAEPVVVPIGESAQKYSEDQPRGKSTPESTPGSWVSSGHVDNPAHAPVLADVSAKDNAARLERSYREKLVEALGTENVEPAVAKAEAALHRLPLVHSTTVWAAVAAWKGGELLSRKALDRVEAKTAARIRELQDKEQLTTEENAEWEELFGAIRATATNDADRAAGLDNFVFANHGVPALVYGEVGVMLDNSVIDKVPGVFATEHDIMRLPGAADNRQGYSPKVLEAYRREVLTGKDYWRVASMARAFAERNRLRPPSFEVKIPHQVGRERISGFLVNSVEAVAALSGAGVPKAMIYWPQLSSEEKAADPASIARDDLTARLMLLLARIEARLEARKQDYVHDELDLVQAAVAVIAGDWQAVAAQLGGVPEAQAAWERIYDRHEAELVAILARAIARATPDDTEARVELAAIGTAWLRAFGRTLVGRLVRSAADFALVPDWFGRVMQPLLRRLLSLGVMYHAAKRATFDPEEHPRGKTTEESTPGSFAPAGGGAEGSREEVYGGLPWPPRTDDEKKDLAEQREKATKVISGKLLEYRKEVAYTGARVKDLVPEALSGMTAPAVVALSRVLGGIHEYPNRDILTDEFIRLTNGTQRPANGHTVHAWTQHGGPEAHVHVDGGSPELLVHEFAHAIDLGARYSRTPEWKRVWTTEIDLDSSPLSVYARKSHIEGFAEAIRASAYAPGMFRNGFPHTYALLRKWGFA